MAVVAHCLTIYNTIQLTLLGVKNRVREIKNKVAFPRIYADHCFLFSWLGVLFLFYIVGLRGVIYSFRCISNINLKNRFIALNGIIQYLNYFVYRSVSHAKKYHLMPKEEPRHKVKEVKFELASEVPSKLSLAIQDLLQELVSPSIKCIVGKHCSTSMILKS